MQVLKFGGSSVGSIDRVKGVSQLVQERTPCVVVLSAMSGTTDELVKICESLHHKNKEGAFSHITDLEERYNSVVVDLLCSEDLKNNAYQMLAYHFNWIKSFVNEDFDEKSEKQILAQGELISTQLFYFYLRELQISATIIPALDFMRIDTQKEPDKVYIREHLQSLLKTKQNIPVIITQGYICRNVQGDIDNLQRGGSDYSATLIGEAIGADEVQIWTDVDGIHNNDPRYVPDTQPVHHLSFDEASELAYFGAKILHPTSVFPCVSSKIPLRIKNTFNPYAHGTLISEKSSGDSIKAIAAKDGITAIKIKSDRMLLAYGFLRRIFEVFEKYKTPIDMITTSEVSVSLTIDNPKYLSLIIEELSEFSSIEIDQDQSIICIVGLLIAEKKKEAVQIFHALENAPIRMISYGGSKHNISILLPAEYKGDALVELSKQVF